VVGEGGPMISQISDQVNAYGQWCECDEGTWNWLSGISRCAASFGIRLSSGESEDGMSLSSGSDSRICCPNRVPESTHVVTQTNQPIESQLPN
jgi:hypothetical protein